MDALSTVSGQEAPKDNDITMCINCGALHARHGMKWEHLTDQEYSELPEELKHLLSKLELARMSE